MAEPAVRFDEIKAWLEGFESCVNERNYNRAKDLFSDSVRYYGIHIPYIQWTDNVGELEWEKEWPFINGFHWDYEKRVFCSADQPRYLGVIWLNWECTGYFASRASYKRTGRATFVFIRASRTPICCLHAHYTLNPGTPFKSYGLDPKEDEEKTRP